MVSHGRVEKGGIRHRNPQFTGFHWGLDGNLYATFVFPDEYKEEHWVCQSEDDVPEILEQLRQETITIH